MTAELGLPDLIPEQASHPGMHSVGVFEAGACGYRQVCQAMNGW